MKQKENDVLPEDWLSDQNIAAGDRIIIIKDGEVNTVTTRERIKFLMRGNVYEIAVKIANSEKPRDSDFIPYSYCLYYAKKYAQADSVAAVLVGMRPDLPIAYYQRGISSENLERDQNIAAALNCTASFVFQMNDTGEMYHLTENGIEEIKAAKE